MVKIKGEEYKIQRAGQGMKEMLEEWKEGDVEGLNVLEV